MSITSSYVDILETASLQSLQTHGLIDSQSPLSVSVLPGGVITKDIFKTENTTVQKLFTARLANKHLKPRILETLHVGLWLPDQR